jgi:hypothetical protein
MKNESSPGMQLGAFRCGNPIERIVASLDRNRSSNEAREGSTMIRGGFDKETRRKAQAF